GKRIEVTLYLGAGAYICGEETALLESLEGKRGIPRLKPPFPATHGLYGMPTVVNNVETLCAVVPIIQDGGEAYKALGTEKSSGTKIFSLSGQVRRPGNYEVEFGKVTLHELVYDIGGGPLDGREIKGVIPGGSSVPILAADNLDIPLRLRISAGGGDPCLDLA
ncbi:NADH-quinone oxidoreductase, F subunit, partial [mine drainage metagenome]